MVIDDDCFGCERLKEMLGAFPNLHVTAACTTYQEALELAIEKRPELLFLDVELDRQHTAFELIEQLYSRLYTPYIIMVTAFDHYSIKAIKKEVFDYLVKPVDMDELRETIKRLEQHIANPLPPASEVKTALSAREQEVVELILAGKTSKEIASSLFVSKSTIDTHRKNILKKTGARSVVDLMRLFRH
jgi:DNA-binding NarL/FixJ family response regulator